MLGHLPLKQPGKKEVEKTDNEKTQWPPSQWRGERLNVKELKLQSGHPPPKLPQEQ